MFNIDLEIIHDFSLYSISLFVFIGGYKALQKKYKNTETKTIFWLKIVLVILGILSPFIVLLLTDPT